MVQLTFPFVFLTAIGKDGLPSDSDLWSQLFKRDFNDRVLMPHSKFAEDF